MIRINLRGPEATKERRSWSMPEMSVGADQAAFGAIMVVTMLLVAGGWWYQGRQLGRLEARLSEVQAERDELSETVQQVDRIRSQTELIRQKLRVIVQLKRNQTGPVLLLDEVSRRLPDGLWLTRMEAVEESVDIQGAALSNTAIADFHSNLRASPYFDEVVLLFSEDTGDAFRFHLNSRFLPASRPESESEEESGRQAALAAPRLRRNTVADGTTGATRARRGRGSRDRWSRSAAATGGGDGP